MSKSLGFFQQPLSFFDVSAWDSQPRRTTSRTCHHVTKILLPSAVHLEERLTVSQAVPEPGQQSVRQKHTVWVFCPWQTQHQSVGTVCPGIQAVAEW